MNIPPISLRTSAEPLSLGLLREHVPSVRAGVDAARFLREGEGLPPEEVTRLLGLRREGSKAQEVLIISALPLIKSITSKEFQRRQAWASRISYDDVLQEAIAGFIRGLLTYDETAGHASSTSYLSMWVTTSIRRKVEALDHDFVIPYEVMERSRRVRAVVGRLTAELGKPPTDEEVLVGLNDESAGESVGAQNFRWGVREGDGLRKKKFLLKHVVEARELGAHSYGLLSLDGTTVDGDVFERETFPFFEVSDGSPDVVDGNDFGRSRLTFFMEAFVAMKIGSRQQDIILRFYGLGEFSEPQVQRTIVTNTGFPPRFVKAVVAAFSAYMPLPGGVFHFLLSSADARLVESLELGWLLPILGIFPDTLLEPLPAPLILTQLNFKVSVGGVL